MLYLHIEKKKKALVAQLYLILCNPIDYSLPGSSVHGILHVWTLEWVAVSFSSQGIIKVKGSNKGGSLI